MSPARLPRPFSGYEYAANAEACRNDEEPCALCGLAVTSRSHEIHVIEGGAGLARIEDTSAGDAGDMGWFDVCTACARRLPKAYRHAVTNG